MVYRLDQLHYLLRSMIGANFTAQLQAPNKALDIGTASGIWVLVGHSLAYSLLIMNIYRKWQWNSLNVALLVLI